MELSNLVNRVQLTQLLNYTIQLGFFPFRR